MATKYTTLLKVLDNIRGEAPAAFKSYHPSEDDCEGLNKARSLAYIHLFLKVRFGVANFSDRHELITDGSQDGGVDAFYIDEENKKLFLVQSKFRTNEKNFDTKKMAADDVVAMEVSRITKGQPADSNGIEFNAKICGFQNKIRAIRDIAKYDYVVIFLGGVKQNDEQIRRLIDNSDYEIYDADTAYKKLVFPLISGTHYDPEEITISINLNNKEHSKLKQKIYTDSGSYMVTIVFVPCDEIGRVLSKYKNAILKYNPRNFLALKKNSVNDQIRKSVIDSEGNGFAILNNGITLLSDNVYSTESTGEENSGQIILTKPQILNGGQTAFTLCSIYESQDRGKMKDKEVMLKIITKINQSDALDDNFVQMISNATNQQSEVVEADRRSNHIIQISLQQKIFEAYGYFYERKKGEFYDGVKEGYVERAQVIDRLDFIKAYLAYLGKPADARRISEDVVFKEAKFGSILGGFNNSYKEMFFAYILYSDLVEMEADYKGNKNGSVRDYGYALLYGKWAVIAAVAKIKTQIPDDIVELKTKSSEMLGRFLGIWKRFDDYVKNKNKDTRYFSGKASNFELYYKVNLLDDDIAEFFSVEKIDSDAPVDLFA